MWEGQERLQQLFSARSFLLLKFWTAYSIITMARKWERSNYFDGANFPFRADATIRIEIDWPRERSRSTCGNILSPNEPFYGGRSNGRIDPEFCPPKPSLPVGTNFFSAQINRITGQRSQT